MYSAQASLGNAYLAGRGVPRSEEKGAEWLRKAEEGVRAGKGGQAGRQGLMSLARMYAMGTGGLPIDKVKAEELFKLAQAAGDVKVPSISKKIDS